MRLYIVFTMGQTLSEPITEKTSTHGSNKKYFYGCSHMQGWRLSKLIFFFFFCFEIVYR